jgi:uncharacterized protein (TIGR03067 family)
MRTHALLIVAAGLLIAADAKDDLKKMDGTWTMVSGEENGEKLPEKNVKTAKLVIKGDMHTVQIGDVTIKGTHKLDPSKKPAAIDAMDTEGPFKGKTTLGIYEIADDTFKVCFAGPGKDRPKEFTTKGGAAVLYHVWKKEKK